MHPIYIMGLSLNRILRSDPYSLKCSVFLRCFVFLVFFEAFMVVHAKIGQFLSPTPWPT